MNNKLLPQCFAPPALITRVGVPPFSTVVKILEELILSSPHRKFSRAEVKSMLASEYMQHTVIRMWQIEQTIDRLSPSDQLRQLYIEQLKVLNKAACDEIRRLMS